MKPHPLAEVFPMMGEDALLALAEDIAAHGLREPIVLHEDGRILDGRCRFAACGIAGVKPQTETFDGTDPVAFVVSKNLHRRHLSASQRAMVAAEIATLGNGQHPGRPIGLAEVPVAKAAALLGVGEMSVKRARIVKRDGVDEVVQAVAAGDLSVVRAREIAKLPKEEQAEALKKPRRKPPTFNGPRAPQRAPEGKPESRFSGLPKKPQSIAKPDLFKHFLKCGQELAWRFRDDPLHARMLGALREFSLIHEEWTSRRKEKEP